MGRFLDTNHKDAQSCQLTVVFRPTAEHLRLDAAGKMAAAADVKTVAPTPLTPDGDNKTEVGGFTKGIRKYYSGPVSAARDLLEY